MWFGTDRILAAQTIFILFKHFAELASEFETANNSSVNESMEEQR